MIPYWSLLPYTQLLQNTFFSSFILHVFVEMVTISITVLNPEDLAENNITRHVCLHVRGGRQRVKYKLIHTIISLCDE